MKRAVHGLGLAYARQHGGVSCDVLDAWFDPSPSVVASLGCLREALRCSPEVDGASLISAIARAEGLPEANLSLGAGSSEIIHRVLPRLLGDGQVVLLDPCYSEYPTLLARLGKPFSTLRLEAEEGFNVNVNALTAACEGASMLILVNPNNPTGVEMPGEAIRQLHERLPGLTIWVDETYVDFGPTGVSISDWAPRTDRVFVLKSLSKAYALSGARAAFLLSPDRWSREIHGSTPPWIVSSLATSAALAALGDRAYYESRWTDTKARISAFVDLLRGGGLAVHAGHIPAVLIRTPKGARAAAKDLALERVYVRVPEGMGEVLGDGWIRVALPRPEDEAFVVEGLGRTLGSPTQ